MILPGTGRGTAAAGGGGGGSRPTQRPEVYTARKLRRAMSLPEVMLWQKLRGGKAGARSRRQHPIGPFVVDFFCRDAGLVVEIDGDAHNRAGRPARDAVREAFLTAQGCRVIRIPAADVLKDADAVAASLASLAASPLHQPAAGPPPRTGEDQLLPGTGRGTAASGGGGGGSPLDATR